MPELSTEFPSAKERRWLDPDRFIELGEDGKLRLFRRKEKRDFVLVKESERTYDSLNWWSITDAFPGLTWEY
jgi:hypothetical protein